MIALRTRLTSALICDHIVTYMRGEPARDDLVWKALADLSRRRILDLLRKRPMTTGELCEQFELSRFGVMKHLGLLVDAGLIAIERRGRERFNHLNPVPIQNIYRRWIRPFETTPADRLLRLRSHIEAKE